jgi:DNA-binding transcriptional ArsR family regulator
MPPIPVLVALADPTRCRIIEILRDGAQPVHVLAGSFKISRPAISRHLRVLKQARLISEKKSGRENRYALHAEKLKPVAEWLATMREAGHAAKAAPQRLVVAKADPKIAKATPKAAAVPEPKAEPPKPAAKPRAEPSISQMGFDF